MSSYSQAAELMRSMISVSRFNKGEASKIFDEVEQAGIKIVVKNNKPACVLFSPQRYEDLMEEMDDLRLLVEAEKRLDDGGPYYSADEVMHQLGITQNDLDMFDDVEID